MTIEIERRFLVSDATSALAESQRIGEYDIRQGYFGWAGGLRVRVRISADVTGLATGLLTLKGPRREVLREEHAYPIDLDQAEHALRSLPFAQVVCKRRYLIRDRVGLVWAIDRFVGPNAGLVIAEIELGDPRQEIRLPCWIGEEITMDRRFGNSSLALSPAGQELRLIG